MALLGYFLSSLLALISCQFPVPSFGVLDARHRTLFPPVSDTGAFRQVFLSMILSLNQY